jgi:hypothetical protein
MQQILSSFFTLSQLLICVYGKGLLRQHWIYILLLYVLHFIFVYLCCICPLLFGFVCCCVSVTGHLTVNSAR